MAKEKVELHPSTYVSVPDVSEILVESAQLHAGTMLPGGKTESTLNQVKLPGSKLTWLHGEGLIVEIRGRKALIPSAGVKVVHFKQV